MSERRGYAIHGAEGFVAAAHADGQVTIVKGGKALHLDPNQVDIVREVLKLAASVHGRVRVQACRDAYDALYEEPQ
jgi:hypothetical protein